MRDLALMGLLKVIPAAAPPQGPAPRDHRRHHHPPPRRRGDDQFARLYPARPARHRAAGHSPGALCRSAGVGVAGGRAQHYPGLWDRLLCLLPFEPAFFARYDAAGDVRRSSRAGEWRRDRETPRNFVLRPALRVRCACVDIHAGQPPYGGVSGCCLYLGETLRTYRRGGAIPVTGGASRGARRRGGARRGRADGDGDRSWSATTEEKHDALRGVRRRR